MKGIFQFAGFAAGLGMLYALSSWLYQDPVAFRRLDVPEPATFSQLKAIHKRTPLRDSARADVMDLPSCSFPSVATSASMSAVTDPFGQFTVRAPGSWRRIEMDTTVRPFRYPDVLYENGSGDRIRISRVATGAVGPTYSADMQGNPLPARHCEASRDGAGTIWAFLAEQRPQGTRYTGDGDAVTSRGRRYKFGVGSWSPGGRDSLAAFIFAAVVAR